jgi:two-component system cell cycle sensor histidine kinase PleC
MLFNVTSDSAPAVMQDWPARDWTAGKLAVALPALSVEASCGEVFDWFSTRPGQPAAVVLREDGRIAGLVNRLQFLARYAQRYYPELYARRSILNLANTQPLIVDEKTPVAELGASVALEHPEALSECFIVTAGGKYLGVGTGAALMRSKVALLQMQEAALSRALARSNDAIRTKTNFLALMSHELRTPLNAIIGFSEVMKGEIFGPLGQPRYREYTADIHAAGSHLLALINDILDLSKAEAGKLDLHAEDVDVAELVGECVRLMRERARSGGLSLAARLPPGLPDLCADRLRLKQVLLNLLSNAIKFTPPGGSVEVRAEIDAAGCVGLAVADTGIGMSAEQIPLALEPFRQIDSPLSRNREGTGLGLSLVKELAERHGAEMIIDSMLGKGTTVSLAFPSARTIRQPDAICA